MNCSNSTKSKYKKNFVSFSAVLYLCLMMGISNSVLATIISGGTSQVSIKSISSAANINYYFNRYGDGYGSIFGQCTACVTLLSQPINGFNGQPLDFFIDVYSMISGPARPSDSNTNHNGESLFNGGSFSLGQGGVTLFDSQISNVSLWVINNQKGAIIAFSYTLLQASILTSLTSGFADIGGDTLNPITLLTTGPFSFLLPTINNFTLDWSANISSTPFNPEQPSSVPEPAFSSMLVVGILFLFYFRRKGAFKGGLANRLR
jgi:hypothetical protein